MINCLIVALASYLIGSVNFAMIVGRIKHLDFRKLGTGNFGTANVFRVTHSPLLALLTLVWDAGKAGLAAYAALKLAPLLLADPGICMLAAAVSAIAGHNHSFLLKFKSGRGIASFLGASLVISPVAGLVWLLSWIPGYAVTGILSVGQILASVYTPVFMGLLWLAGLASWQAFVFSLLACLLILEAHLEKIAAIRSGKEPRNYLSIKKKKRVEY